MSFSVSPNRTPSPEFTAWVEDASRQRALEFAFARGLKLRRSGTSEYVGPCPNCGGRDRFSINTRKNVFHCRHEKLGGGVINLVMHVDKCDFIAACEHLTGRKAPDGSQSQPLSQEQLNEIQKKRKESDAKRELEEAKSAAAATEKALATFMRGVAAAGTLVEDYFAKRQIKLPPNNNTLRFVKALDFLWRSESGQWQVIHSGPAMLAAILDHVGEFSAVHVTWLDLQRENGRAKIIAPDGEEQPGKKIFGPKKGCAIRLYEPTRFRRIVIGEGIETTASVFTVLSKRNLWHDAAFWVGIDLYNIGGRAAYSVDHPKNKDKDGRPIKIPGPKPDMKDCETLYPPDCVDEVVLLGDGDSDPFTTKFAMQRAADRWRKHGCKVRICFAKAGKDFNDMLMEGKDGRQ